MLAISDTLKNVPDSIIGGQVPHRADEMLEMAEATLSASPPFWYFILLFFMLTGIAISQLYFGDLIQNAFKSAVRYSVSLSKFNDNSLIQRQKDNILYTLYFLTGAFVLLIIQQRYQWYPYNFTGFYLYLVNLAFLIVFFFSRIIFTNLVAVIFDQRKVFREYLYHSFTINKLFGLLVVSPVFLLLYTEYTVHEIIFYISLVLLIILLGMKIAKGIVFSVKKEVFNFYMFLYLCALEIVPILLIYKWITTVV